MSQAGIRKDSSLNQISDLLDIADELLRIGTNAALVEDASWRVTVEVLGSNGDSSNTRAELLAEVVDGELQSSLPTTSAHFSPTSNAPKTYQLKIKSLLSRTSPKSQQKSSIGVHSGLNRRDQIARSSRLNHGEESSSSESSIGTGKFFGGIELIGEVLLGSWRAVEVQVSLPI